MGWGRAEEKQALPMALLPLLAMDSESCKTKYITVIPDRVSSPRLYIHRLAHSVKVRIPNCSFRILAGTQTNGAWQVWDC